MLIATSLAAVVLASALSGAASPAATLPPLTISVSATEVSPTLVRHLLAETDAVWRGAGLSFVWRREREAGDPRAVTTAACDGDPSVTPTLRVVIGSGKAADASKRGENSMALGWIVFEDGAPQPEIYLSYDNAQAYLANAREVVGPLNRMSIEEREMLLARAMGRALAHELGHYLFATKTHTSRGLMRAVHTATEFFSSERSAFLIDAAQRRALSDRLRRDAQVAMHDPR